jgi:hypothetical protein
MFKDTHLRLEFQRFTAQQTQIDLRSSLGSYHGSFCSNTEQGRLTGALLSVPIICISSDGQRMRRSFRLINSINIKPLH